MANFFANMKISRKLVAVFLATSVIAMGVNIFIYANLNVALNKINTVFSSNIGLNQLSDTTIRFTRVLPVTWRRRARMISSFTMHPLRK